jgi:hypothetical protein
MKTASELGRVFCRASKYADAISGIDGVIGISAECSSRRRLAVGRLGSTRKQLIMATLSAPGGGKSHIKHGRMSLNC